MQRCSEEPLGRQIYHTAQDIRNMAEKILYPHDLTTEQMHLLKSMSVSAGVTQRALGRMVNKTPANLTRILDRLEAKSLIVRQPDPNDRRVYQVFLTEKGLALVREVEATFQEFSERMLRGVSDEMQRQVRVCLEKLTKNIELINMELRKDAP